MSIKLVPPPGSNPDPIDTTAVESLNLMFMLLKNPPYQNLLFRELIKANPFTMDFRTAEYIFSCALDDILGRKWGEGEHTPEFSMEMFIDAAPSVVYLNPFFEAQFQLGPDLLDKLMQRYIDRVTFRVPPLVI